MAMSFWGTMLGYMAVSSYTPGPGNILAMNTTARFGWQKSRRLILGICCGYLCVQFLCTIALYGLNRLMASALAVLRYAGAAYILWLAFHILVSRPQAAGQETQPTFRTGFLLQLVNVKIYFYISTLLSVYLIPSVKRLPYLFAAGVGVVLFGSIACLAWAAAGAQLQGAYAKHYRAVSLILALFLLYCAWSMISLQIKSQAPNRT